MANRISIRSGSSTPSPSDLLDKELGYDSNNKILYINNGGEIEEIGNAIKVHAPTHATGGTDPITPASIGAATVAAVQDAQTTANNAQTTANNAQTTAGSKADKAVPAVAGNLAGLNADGNLADSGVDPDNLATKAVPAAVGNFAALDSQGNLTDSGMQQGDLFRLIYPVGSIYISTAATNPASLFGGTWEQLKDRFLLGAGGSYAAGSTGGEVSHRLTVAEMPSHTHRTGIGGNGTETYGNGPEGYVTAKVIFDSGSGQYIANTGGGGTHNNMPPYLAVYCWRRTA